MIDEPLYEREISDERTTARVTVDVADGELWSVLSLEPASGALRQIVMTLTPDRCTELISILQTARWKMTRNTTGGTHGIS